MNTDNELPTALAAAINWKVTLTSGNVSTIEQDQFTSWLHAHPHHAQAWVTVNEALDSTFKNLNEDPAHQRLAHSVLSTPPSRRRVLRSLVALTIATGGGAAILDRHTPLQTMASDHRTGTGERRSVMLADGSELMLNARSAVDVHFSPSVRRIHLRAGSVYARVASDATRPFIVASHDGEVQALGTIFSVTRHEHDSVVSVIEHRVEVRAAGQAQVLQTGQGIRFSPLGISAPSHALGDAAAWHNGMLITHDEPLGSVIEALRPYRHGVIRITPAAARLRVLGAFHLDNTDLTLESLQQTLPIEVKRLGPWFISIDLQQKNKKI